MFVSDIHIFFAAYLPHAALRTQGKVNIRRMLTILTKKKKKKKETPHVQNNIVPKNLATFSPSLEYRCLYVTEQVATRTLLQVLFLFSFTCDEYHFHTY